jgi:hypothetical protein
LCQLFHKRLKDKKGEKGLFVEPSQEEIARIMIESGLQLHREVGPGLLESVFETTGTIVKPT